MSRLKPIAEGQPRSWRLTIDGRVEQVASLSLEDPRFGTLSYGMSEQGYNTWSFHENGGGGVVTVPFTFREGGLLVGVVEQLRPNQGGSVLNVPRGFLDPDEESAHAAARELSEETGLETTTIEAARLADMLSVAAVARLLAHLKETGRLP
jgi:hypothetical protein